MRRQQDRLALSEELPQPVPDKMSRLRIEARRRFIENKELWIVDECARERQAALHATRERANIRSALAGQPGEVEQARYTLLELRVGHAEVAAINGEILDDGEIWIEVIHLRHDAYAHACLARCLRHRLSHQRDAAGVGIG